MSLRMQQKPPGALKQGRKPTGQVLKSQHCLLLCRTHGEKQEQVWDIRQGAIAQVQAGNDGGLDEAGGHRGGGANRYGKPEKWRRQDSGWLEGSCGLCIISGCSCSRVRGGAQSLVSFS